MLFLFADESGDIKHASGTRHFVYVGILTKSKKECEKTLDQLKENYVNVFHRKFFKKEIKASDLEQSEIIYFLNGLKELDYSVFCAHIDTYDAKKQFNLGKDGALKRMQLLEIVLGNVFATAPLFNDGIGKIVIDKGLSEELCVDIRKRLAEKYKDVPRIEAESSHKVAGIQIADLVAGVIRMHLKGDSIYFPYIKDKIRTMTEL